MGTRSLTVELNRDRTLLWEWTLPLYLGEVLFGIFFVMFPNPSVFKAVLTALLLFMHGAMGYWRLKVRQVASGWFLWGMLWALSMGCYSAGLAILTSFRLQPLSRLADFGVGCLIVVGLAGVAYLSWRYYTPPISKLLEADTDTGRFDLERGTFSLAVPPSLYEFKRPILRKASAILVGSSGTLIAISAASGVHGGRQMLMGKDLSAGALELVLAVIFVMIVPASFYTYRWIRRWEKQTGRTMWIKGFEPGSNSA